VSIEETPEEESEFLTPVLMSVEDDKVDVSEEDGESSDFREDDDEDEQEDKNRVWFMLKRSVRESFPKTGIQELHSGSNGC
jgi:hypothetical protein